MLAHTLLGTEGRSTVVFLHGFMGAGDDWREVAEKLGPGRPEHPGGSARPRRFDRVAGGGVYNSGGCRSGGGSARPPGRPAMHAGRVLDGGAAGAVPRLASSRLLAAPRAGVGVAGAGGRGGAGGTARRRRGAGAAPGDGRLRRVSCRLVQATSFCHARPAAWFSRANAASAAAKPDVRISPFTAPDGDRAAALALGTARKLARLYAGRRGRARWQSTSRSPSAWLSGRPTSASPSSRTSATTCTWSTQSAYADLLRDFLTQP